MTLQMLNAKLAGVKLVGKILETSPTPWPPENLPVAPSPFMATANTKDTRLTHRSHLLRDFATSVGLSGLDSNELAMMGSDSIVRPVAGWERVR